MFFYQFRAPFGQIVERVGVSAFVSPSGEKGKGIAPRLPRCRIVGTLVLYEPTVIQYRQGIGQRIGIAVTLGNVVARLVGTDELRTRIIDFQATLQFITKFPRLEFSIIRKRARPGIIGTPFGMAHHYHHLFTFGKPINDRVERSEMRNRGLGHKIAVQVMPGGNAPEERTLVANVITIFAVDGDGLDLACIGSAAHAQVFLRAMENDAVHDTGSVFVADAIYQIQAVPNVEAVDDIQAIPNTDAVDYVQAVTNTDTVNHVQAILYTDAVYNMYAICNTNAIYNMNTVNYIQAVNDMDAINDMQAVNDVDAVNDMQAVNDVDAVNDMSLLRPSFAMMKFMR